MLQVNHPRMAPGIGYFDLTHLEPRTGAADASFSGSFDAVEAFNGFFLTSPARVREGAADMVALARRGLHVAATGNSDSHHLLYEEAGYPRTYAHVSPEPIATRMERVLAAIRRGDTTVSSGPLVEMTVDGAPIGSVVVPKGGRTVHVHVRVSAPTWVPVEHVENLARRRGRLSRRGHEAARRWCALRGGRGPSVPGRRDAPRVGDLRHAAA